MRRLVSQRGQLFQGAGSNDLPRPIVVGGGQAHGLDGCQYLFPVPADYGGHGRGCDCRGLGHTAATFPDQHYGGFDRDHTCHGRGGKFTHGMPGDHAGESSGGRAQLLGAGKR